MVKIGQPHALLALYLVNPKEKLRHINTGGPKHVLKEDGYLNRCHPPIIGVVHAWVGQKRLKSNILRRFFLPVIR